VQAQAHNRHWGWCKTLRWLRRASQHWAAKQDHMHAAHLAHPHGKLLSSIRKLCYATDRLPESGVDAAPMTHDFAALHPAGCRGCRSTFGAGACGCSTRGRCLQCNHSSKHFPTQTPSQITKCWQDAVHADHRDRRREHAGGGLSRRRCAVGRTWRFVPVNSHPMRVSAPLSGARAPCSG
jgi:hypothetical protein